MIRLGLYEVDIGFSPEGGYGDILAFADVDSDKFTDMITLNQAGNAIELHLFDSYYKKFVHSNTISVTGCYSIRNIVVGRSATHLRMFVTCEGSAGTMVRFVDRISHAKEAGLEDYTWLVPE